jgi:hypothetical protein
MKQKITRAIVLAATFLAFFTVMLIAELGGKEQGVRTLVSWVSP